jgi:3-phosphoshikimate 1-carboxyvinyltransferase
MAWSSTSTESAIALPSGRLRGRLAPPPSKSVTQRFLALAFLSARPTTIHNPLTSDDTARFRDALVAAGARLETLGAAWRLTPGVAPRERVDIAAGDSGTLLRFLTAILAAIPGDWRIDGSARLRERPVGPLVDALRRLGARVEYEGRAGFAPLAVTGATLAGGEVELDAGTSSQFASGLLMAALCARAPVVVRLLALTSAPYLEITLRAIATFGGRVERLGSAEFRVHPGRISADHPRVEGDASAACYAAAGAALSGGEVVIDDLPADSPQGDTRFFDLLAAMGADVEHGGDRVVVRGRELRAVDADLGAMPDQVPTLAALAPYARGRTRIRNVAHLRIKESDRLRAVAGILDAAGARARETDDGLQIEGDWHGRPAPAQPAGLDPVGDHRIAMSAALLALGRPNLTLAQPWVVAKSYPTFWQEWRRLVATGEPASRESVGSR